MSATRRVNATGGSEATNRGQPKCSVPSNAGKKDDSDRHGILDFFLVTIGSSSDLFGSMRTIQRRTSARDTWPRLPTKRVNVPRRRQGALHNDANTASRRYVRCQDNKILFVGHFLHPLTNLMECDFGVKSDGVIFQFSLVAI